MENMNISCDKLHYLGTVNFNNKCILQPMSVNTDWSRRYPCGPLVDHSNSANVFWRRLVLVLINLTILFRSFGFLAPKHKHFTCLVIHSFDYECTWGGLFLKLSVCNKEDINVYITLLNNYKKQQMHWPSESNKNIDILFRAHYTFILFLSSGAQSQKIGKPNNLKVFVSLV